MITLKHNSNFVGANPGSFDSCIAYWKFDDNVGTSGLNSNVGSLTGSIDVNFANYVTTGRYNNGLNFNGLAGANNLPGISLTNNVLNGLGSVINNYTVSLWIKIPSTQVTYARIVEKDGTPYPMVIRMGTDNKIHLIIWDGTNSSICPATNALAFNQWAHYCWAVTRPGNILMYTDGKLDREMADTTIGTVSNTSNLLWGNVATSLDRHFIGTVDEVAIFNEALDAEKIKMLYKAGSLAGMNVKRECDDFTIKNINSNNIIIREVS